MTETDKKPSHIIRITPETREIVEAYRKQREAAGVRLPIGAAVGELIAMGAKKASK